MPNYKVMGKYNRFFKESIEQLKKVGNYRVFNYIDRRVNEFPIGYSNNSKVRIFCSNDYLNMGHNSDVISAMQTTLQQSGAGAGGTRNISGSNNHQRNLEIAIGNLHNKDAILFNSCYTANGGFFNTIKKIIPDCYVLSDEKNHASMILGIKNTNLKKAIFKHNDIFDLESKLRELDLDQPKLITFESIYSMSGNIAPLMELVELAKKYNAMTFVDEVHAIGLYGVGGRGLIQAANLENEIDAISGTLGKACGVVGGYIAGDSYLVDCVRSYSSEFIFTTALPPAICAGALKSIEILDSPLGDLKRYQLHQNVQILKAGLKNLPILETNTNQSTHITCVMIGDSVKCKEISEYLFNEYNIYIQPINFPTVNKGGELLRITVSPLHSKLDIKYLINALQEIAIKFEL